MDTSRWRLVGPLLLATLLTACAAGGAAPTPPSSPTVPVVTTPTTVPTTPVIVTPTSTPISAIGTLRVTVTLTRSPVDYYSGPCAGVPITVRDAATGAVVGEAVTDARGVASLAFPPGHYTVAVPVPPPDTACGRSTLGVFPQSRVVVVPPARVTEVAVDWLLYVDPPRPTRQP